MQGLLVRQQKITLKKNCKKSSIINQHIKQIGVTRVIVAHRKETVNIADRIIDLESLIKENYVDSAK